MPRIPLIRRSNMLVTLSAGVPVALTALGAFLSTVLGIVL